MGCAPGQDVLPQTLPLAGRGEAALMGSGGAPRRGGAGKVPVTAEPSVFPLAACSLPWLLGMQLPALPQCSTSSSAPSPPRGFHPKQPWDTLACPPLPQPEGEVLFCPGRGRDRVQCFLTGQGRFVPASASFPCLSPVYLHPWLQRWNVPGAATSGLRCGSWLLPVPPQAASASQPSHSSSCPGKSRTL